MINRVRIAMRTRFFLLLLLIAHLSLQGFIALSIRNFFPRKTLQDYSLPKCRAIPLPCLLACFSRQIFFATPLENFPKPVIFFTICAGKFITNLLIYITNFVTRVTKFLTSVTKFVIKTLLYERKKYLADSENYHGLRKNFLADSDA